ncbi:hypothetical protein FQA39_LY01577 [Lamprigera yunnana]|nr:hypothetical protein FQA39_LY01577 [Lamprigera yunnana]
MDEEKRDHDLKMKKMEAEMEQVFEMKEKRNLYFYGLVFYTVLYDNLNVVIKNVDNSDENEEDFTVSTLTETIQACDVMYALGAVPALSICANEIKLGTRVIEKSGKVNQGFDEGTADERTVRRWFTGPAQGTG